MKEKLHQVSRCEGASCYQRLEEKVLPTTTANGGGSGRLCTECSGLVEMNGSKIGERYGDEGSLWKGNGIGTSIGGFSSYRLFCASCLSLQSLVLFSCLSDFAISPSLPLP